MRKPKSDWTDLFLAFRLLIDPRKLWLAFKGIVFSVALAGLLLALFGCLYNALEIPMGAPPPALPLEGLDARLAEEAGFPVADTDILGALLSGRLGAAARATRAFACDLVTNACRELGAVLAVRCALPFGRLVMVWSCQSLATLAVLGLLIGFGLLFVWSYYGAAIMRLTAVEYAVGDRLDLESACAYTRRKHQSFYGPPLGLALAIVALELLLMAAGFLVWNLLLAVVALVGLLAIGVAAAVVRDRSRSTAKGALAGLVGVCALAGLLWAIAALGWRIPYAGELVVGLLSPMALLGGLVAAMLGLWLILGLPLMAGAVATGDVGAFDAWSRSFHYLFTHPWRYAFYVLAAVAHGGACLAFVYLVRIGAEWATLAPLSMGTLVTGGEASETVVGFFLMMDRVLLDIVFLAFCAGYVFTSATVIYFLLRLRADGTPITEVHLEPRDADRLLPASAPPES